MNEKIYFSEPTFLKKHITMILSTLALATLSIVVVAIYTAFTLDARALDSILIFIGAIALAILSCLPLKAVTNSKNLCYTKTSSGRFYCINLKKLNNILEYNFQPIMTSTSDATLTSGQVDTMLAKIAQAISDYENGSAPISSQEYAGYLIEFINYELVKDDERCYEISYEDKDGKKSRHFIYKIYKDFNPFDKPVDEMEYKPLKPYKYPIIIVAVCIVAMLIALNIDDVPTTNDDITNDTNSLDDQSPVKNLSSFDMNILSYSVDESHTGYAEHLFYDESTGDYYGITSITSLGNTLPEDYFAMMKSEFQMYYTDVASDEIVEWVSASGEQGYSTTIIVLLESTILNTRVIIVPEVNSVITIGSQSTFGTTMNLDQLAQSITFPVIDENFVIGSSFFSDKLNATYSFSADSNVVEYLSHITDETFSGTYEIFLGDSALDTVAEFEGLNLSKSDLEFLVTYDIDGYIVNAGDMSIEDQFIFDSEGNILGYNPNLVRYVITKDWYYAMVLTFGDTQMLHFGYIVPQINGFEVIEPFSMVQSSWIKTTD